MKGKQVFHLIVSALLVVFLLSTAMPAATAGGGEQARIWVQFAPGAKAHVERALHAANAEFHYTFDELDAFVVTLPQAALLGLAKNPNVLLIEEDMKRYPAEQTVPYGVDMVQARNVWDADKNGVIDSGAPTGSNRLVCVIDSGVFAGHEDLQGVNFVGGNPPDWSSDACGHGTHVVGTIAAANNGLGVVGVTPGAVNLWIEKVFNENECTSIFTSSLVAAANSCAEHGANVVNVSLVGFYSKLENQAFNNLYSKGILTIAAAGNAGTTLVSYPAGYASVVSVSAVNENKTVAYFSQKNKDVEIAAPGVGVLSTLPYVQSNTVTVDGVTYYGGRMANAARGIATGPLVDGGFCYVADEGMNGNVVLCEWDGSIDFYPLVEAVQAGGGMAAVIFNYTSGSFSGTLDPYQSSIPVITLSREDGLYLAQNNLGQEATVKSLIEGELSGYAYSDGTSSAAAHASAAAALVWSANPGWTNQQVRDALNITAEDLGLVGRDIYYGYGLVQAKAALDYLNGGGQLPPSLAVSVATDKATYKNGQTALINTTVKDAAGAPVVGANVSVSIVSPIKTTLPALLCTTGPSGACQVQWTIDTFTYGKGTYTVTSIATSGGLTGKGVITFVAK